MHSRHRRVYTLNPAAPIKFRGATELLHSLTDILSATSYRYTQLGRSRMYLYEAPTL